MPNGDIMLIGEIGINANGSVDIAKKLVSNCVETGFDYVKFQKRTIDEVYTPYELNSYRESPWGTTFREQKEGLEFNKEQYDQIDFYCKEHNIGWFASPWDLQSIDFLVQYKPDYIKIPSALVTWKDYLIAIKNTKIPVIISLGMTNWHQVENALKLLGDSVYGILHTTSSYPCKIEDLNLSKLITMEKEFGNRYKIGYSNHSPSVIPVLIAMALGAEIIEVHVTLDRAMYGSDQSSAIEKRGLETIGEWAKQINKSFGDGSWAPREVEKGTMSKLRKYYDF